MTKLVLRNNEKSLSPIQKVALKDFCKLYGFKAYGRGLEE